MSTKMKQVRNCFPKLTLHRNFTQDNALLFKLGCFSILQMSTNHTILSVQLQYVVSVQSKQSN